MTSTIGAMGLLYMEFQWVMGIVRNQNIENVMFRFIRRAYYFHNLFHSQNNIIRGSRDKPSHQRYLLHPENS